MPRLFMLSVIILCACHSHRTPVVQEEKGDRIVMMEMKIQKQDTGVAVSILNKTESPGALKINRNSHHGPSYLQVYTWRNHQAVDSMAIEHPLYKHLEYVNTDGRFSTKDTVLGEAEFLLRMQVRGDHNEVHILEVLPGKPKKQITVFTL